MEKAYSELGKIHLYRNELHLNKFVPWLYETIKPYISGNIFEIGSGLGTISEKIICDYKSNDIFLSDIDPEYVLSLTERFRAENNVRTIKFDLEKTEDYENLRNKFDTVISLNVLEHIEDDLGALNNIYGLLKPGGRFLLLVPAHKFLFNSIDRLLGHKRRYSRNELTAKIKKTNFTIENIFYFNFLAIFGWYLNGSIFKKKEIGNGLLKTFNSFIPYIKFFEENILRNKTGISLISILKKD